MNKKRMQQKAEQLRRKVGGKIFAFPIEEENPFSEYAVVVFMANQYHIYPKAGDISHAALGVLTILEQLVEAGMKANYSDDVRLVSYEAQMNAPDVRMRRLRNDSSLYSTR